jgi:hypothetical protein
MPLNLNGLSQQLESCQWAAADCKSCRSISQCGRPAGQISPINSALAASGPAVCGSLQGAHVPLWTRMGPRDTSGAPGGGGQARHVTRWLPARSSRAAPRMRAWPRPMSWELAGKAWASQGAAAVFACIFRYHGHICVYNICICLYMHVCVCILNH